MVGTRAVHLPTLAYTWSPQGALTPAFDGTRRLILASSTPRQDLSVGVRRSSFSLRGGFSRVPQPRPHGRSLVSWRPLIRRSYARFVEGAILRVAACEGAFLRIAACEGANLRPPDFPSLMYVVRPVPLQNRPVVSLLRLGFLPRLDSSGSSSFTPFSFLPPPLPSPIVSPLPVRIPLSC